MGAKICRPKMMDCINCKFNTHPTKDLNYPDAPSKSFCYEDECPFNIQRAMVRNSKIIAWEN